jgi:hypothetical protein
MTIMPSDAGDLSSNLIYPIDIDLGMAPDGRIKPSTLMRWAATPALRYEMVRRQFTQPLLLITVQRLEPVKLQGMDEVDMLWRDWRHFTERLDIGWMFLKLPTAGQLRVMVSVIDAGTRRVRNRIDTWIQLPFKGSEGNLYHESGAFSHAFDGMKAINTGYRFLVYISKEDLARPLPQFADRIFGEYFTKQPKDTCRVCHRVPALLLMVLSNVLLYWPIRLALTGLMLLGTVRIINWQFVQPIRLRAQPLQKYQRLTTVWGHNKSGERRHWVLLYLNPFMLLVGPTIYWLGSLLASSWAAAEQPPKHIVPWTWTQCVVNIDLMAVCLVGYAAIVIWATQFGLRLAVSRGWIKPPDAPRPVVDKVGVMDASLAGITQQPGTAVQRRRPLRRVLAFLKSETCQLYEVD